MSDCQHFCGQAELAEEALHRLHHAYCQAGHQGTGEGDRDKPMMCTTMIFEKNKAVTGVFSNTDL